MDHTPSITHTLILRLWPEQCNHEQIVWRGYLDDVENGERIYFQSLEGLIEKIHQILANRCK